MGGIQIPYLPNTFDIGRLIDAFRTGTGIQQHKQELEERSKERELRAKQLEQLMKQADLESQLTGLKAKGDIISLLESFTGEQQGAARGKPITLSAPGYGIEGIDIVPGTLEDVMARELEKKRQESLIKESEGKVRLPEGMAESFGLPAGTTEIDKELITKLEQLVQLPSEMGGGRAPKSAADLMKTVFTEREAGKRTAQSSGATIQAAQIRAAAAREGKAPADYSDDPTVDVVAQQVASGQLKPTSIPGKPEYKRAVLSRLGLSGTAVPDKTFLDKLDSFSTAQSMLESFGESIQKFKNAKGLWESTQALAQVDAERKAFSRLVGRSLGEKGVFTDQDKEDFARVMSTNVPTLVLAPTWSEDRNKRLLEIMDRVRNRTINDFEKRTGAKYRQGGAPPAGGGPKTAEEFLSKF